MLIRKFLTEIDEIIFNIYHLKEFENNESGFFQYSQ